MELIDKQKLLEWLRTREANSHSDIYAASYLSVIVELKSGTFDTHSTQEWQKNANDFEQMYKDEHREKNRLVRERNALLEGMRKLARTNVENLFEIREWKGRQYDPDVQDIDWYNHIARSILAKTESTAIKG